MSAPSTDTTSSPNGYPLAGTVSKALLVVAPAFARERDFVQYLKCKLYDAGFIVVREEFRLLNYEIASKLCMNLDSPAPLLPANNVQAPSSPTTTAAAAACAEGDVEGGKASLALPLSLLSAPQDLIGTAYLFVLARTSCHALLQSFVTSQLCGEDAEVLETFLEEHCTQRRELPFWISQTAAGATRAVALLFPRMLAEDVPTSAVSREYVQANLKQALVPALTELARQKPENPLRWLAMQLLANNTQSPPMMSNPS
ncbi:Dpy-30 motif containing protein [Lotmaria passim]